MRARMRLPVRICGMDANGDVFEQDAFTIDISPAGAQIWGVYRNLRHGSIIYVEHRLEQARFRVMWVGHSGTPNEGRVGLKLEDRDRYIWRHPLPQVAQDDYEGPRAPVITGDQAGD